MSIRFGSACVLLLWSVTAAAGVYKWVDDQGRVHYGDRPHGQQAEQVDVKPAPASAPSSTPGPGEQATSDEDRQNKQQRLLDAYATERARKKAELEKKKSDRAEKKRKCTVAKDNLKRMKQAGRMFAYDKEGKRQYYSDDERSASLTQYQKQISKHCK